MMSICDKKYITVIHKMDFKFKLQSQFNEWTVNVFVDVNKYCIFYHCPEHHRLSKNVLEVAGFLHDKTAVLSAV